MFVGAQVNVWDKVLTDEDVASMAACKADLQVRVSRHKRSSSLY
jgi:hypothetical protein